MILTEVEYKFAELMLIWKPHYVGHCGAFNCAAEHNPIWSTWHAALDAADYLGFDTEDALPMLLDLWSERGWWDPLQSRTGELTDKGRQDLTALLADTHVPSSAR